MAKKLMSIMVHGKNHKWSFWLYADPMHLEEWRSEGIDIELMANTVPVWVGVFGLVKQWCWLQDLFNFKFMEWFKK